MSQASDYLENALVNSLLGKTSDLGALASAPTVHVALCTSAPVDSDTGTTISETGYTGYARQLANAAAWASASAGTSTNATEIAFPVSTGAADTVTHFALVDAITTGNLLAFGTLGSSLTTSSGVTPKFEIGDLSLTIQ